MIEINWADPLADYSRIYSIREDAIKRLLKKPGAVRPLLEYYRTHWAEFICDWGMTFDPRHEDPERKHAPFILFPRQIEYVNWVYDRYTNRQPGLGEKSRDVGFTWLNAAIGAIIWLTTPWAVVGYGSRKKELVDNGDADPDSILWKVRAFIDNLPAIFLPEDYKAGRKWGIIPNPANNALIKGEIGDEIGRGGRASIYFPDEFAHLEHQEAVESSLSATTDCRIYISTVNGVGNLFYRLRHHLPSEQIFIFDWKDDPRKRRNPDLPPEMEPWYIKQKTDLLPTTLASQVDRDYNAAVANSFIEAGVLRDAQATPISSIEQPKDTPWRIGIDASGMGNDETVIWRRRGRLSLPPLTYRKLDGVQMATIVEKECEKLLKQGPIAMIGIERDGPGGSCADQLKYGPFASITVAVHTGAKLSDGENHNLRAWLHQQARDYLTDNQVHLPADDIFSTQATAIQFSYKGGLLLIESKEEYRSRFSMGRTKAEKASGRSPDRWDAFVLTFIPTRAKPITQVAVASDLFTDSKAWRPLDTVLGY